MLIVATTKLPYESIEFRLNDEWRKLSVVQGITPVVEVGKYKAQIEIQTFPSKHAFHSIHGKIPKLAPDHFSNIPAMRLATHYSSRRFWR